MPFSYIIEKPLQDWTPESSALIGSALTYVDYRAPIGIIHDKAQRDRQELEELGRRRGEPTSHRHQRKHNRAALPDERTLGRQVFNLRCEVREQLIDFLQKRHLEALPRQRSDVVVSEAANAEAAKAKVVREATGGGAQR